MTKIYKMMGVLFILFAIVFVLYQGSSEYLSAGRNSERLAVWVNTLIVEETGKTESSVGTIELIIRKIAHLLEYLFMGTVVFGVVNRLVKHRIMALVIILMITLPLPFIDEFFIQRMTPGRTSQMFDVFIDMMGIAMAFVIGIFYELIWIFRRESRNEGKEFDLAQ